MSRAQFTSRVVQRPHRQRFITLTLTEGEADLVLDLVSQVTGKPALSPRKYARRIRRSLTALLAYDETHTDAYALRSKKPFKYHTYDWGKRKREAAFTEEIKGLKGEFQQSVRDAGLFLTGRF